MCMHICICRCVYIRAHTYIYIYIYTYIYTYIYIYIYILCRKKVVGEDPQSPISPRPREAILDIIYSRYDSR